MHSVAMAIVIETCVYHGHSLYYQATVLAIVIYCLRLFNVAMAMVVWETRVFKVSWPYALLCYYVGNSD